MNPDSCKQLEYDWSNPIDIVRATASPLILAKTLSPKKFQAAPHLALIDKAITDAIAGIGPRWIIVQAPPRHGKSVLISQYFPAWYMSTFPDNSLILTSYAADTARKFGMTVRDILKDPENQKLLGVQIRKDQDTVGRFSIQGHDGYMLCAGVGGPVLGKGANALVSDDDCKNASAALSPRFRENQWDWWLSTSGTRLEPGGIVIITAQRWHADDLIGRIEKEHAEPILNLRFPALAEEDDVLGRKPGEALWPERYSAEVLRRRRDSGTRSRFWFSAQFQQRPVRGDSYEWPDDYFDDIWAEESEWPERFDLKVIALDPSKGRDAHHSDYSALVAIGLAKGIIWVDCWLERRTIAKMIADGIKFARWNAPIQEFVIEGNAFQELLQPEFIRQLQDQNLAPLPFSLVENTINKKVRIGWLGPYLAQKRLKFRRSAGSRLCVAQMQEFTIDNLPGVHDDGPDALAMGLKRIQERQGGK